MNTVRIGREFEKEAYEFLKLKFDEVIWLSEKNKSAFDFKCIKDGKEYYGDAKYTKYFRRPRLSYRQDDADFVVFKYGENEIEYIEKKDIKEKTTQQKIESTTITIERDTHRDLSLLKINTNAKNFDEVLRHAIKMLKEHQEEEKK